MFEYVVLILDFSIGYSALFFRISLRYFLKFWEGIQGGKGVNDFEGGGGAGQSNSDDKAKRTGPATGQEDPVR